MNQTTYFAQHQLNNYIDRVVEIEYEFIVQNKIIPFVLVYTDGTETAKYLKGNSSIFPEEDYCDVSKIGDYILEEGKEFLEVLDIDRTIELVEKIKKILSTYLDESIVEIGLYNQQKSNQMSAMIVFGSREELVEYLFTEYQLLQNSEVTSVKFSNQGGEKGKQFIDKILRNNSDFMSKYGLIPVIFYNKIGQYFSRLIPLKYEGIVDGNLIFNVIQDVRYPVGESDFDFEAIQTFIDSIKDTPTTNTREFINTLLTSFTANLNNEYCSTSNK